MYRKADENNIFEYIEPHTTNVMVELKIPFF